MTHTPDHKTTTRSTYVGLFDDRNAADKAARDLRTAGFKDDEIGYAWRDDSGKTQTEGDTKAGEMAAGGAVTGAALGGLIGAAAAGLIGRSIEDLVVLEAGGPIVAGGILASTLTGAAVGTAAGGITGGLVGMGIPDEEAKYYDSEFREGRTLMTVRNEGRYDEAGDVIRRGGGWDYDTRNERTGTTTKKTTV